MSADPKTTDERLTDADRDMLKQATEDAWAQADAAMMGYMPRFGYRLSTPDEIVEIHAQLVEGNRLAREALSRLPNPPKVDPRIAAMKKGRTHD